ncbi:MAG: AarF/ABC1/UbiB kinase family protein [Deltaproteobacteria bacterium]|nr:AarF/ABC1/UbiB kinase family protein [Deltaproteobacteria bacterium]
MEGARRALGLERKPEDAEARRQELFREAKKTADAVLKTLGEMKGLPLKLGQMASYIDGIAPPGYEERFQARLKRLLDRAPPLSPESAVTVVTAELGAPPDEVFEEWEAQPFAAASIGQVHRAVTRDGVPVAVKVQYPGIDKAIENDLKSVSLLESMVSPLGRKFGSREVVEEIKRVFLDELDYVREADNAELFRRIHAKDAELHIPRVVRALSTRRVLTCELVGGTGYAEFAAGGSQADRDAAGTSIWRFMMRALFRHGVLYADPHPGNYRFWPGRGGRVSFLDFGCVKVLPPELLVGMKRYITAAMDEDWEAFDRACVEVLGYEPNDATWDLYRSYTIELLRPLTTHEDWHCSPAVARRTVTFLVDGGKDLLFKDGRPRPTALKPPKIPHDFTFVSRLQWGLASVLGGLRSIAAFRAISEDWIRGPHLPVE